MLDAEVKIEVTERRVGPGYYTMRSEAEKAEGRRLLDEARSRTMWQALSDACAIDPDKIALVATDDAGTFSRVSYGELTDRIRRLSAGLASIGVQRGDRVVLWMTNTIEWVVSAYAITRLGAILVPVNTFLKPPEIRYFMSQSGARFLVMIDGFRKLDMPEMLAEICPGIGGNDAPGAIFNDALPDMRSVVMYGRSGKRVPYAYDWETLARDVTDEQLALADAMAAKVKPTDLAMVKYTSGSTSQPKGVMLEQGGIVANGLLHSRRMPAGRDDVYFSMMPFFHAGGSIYGLTTMLVNGGTLVFNEAFDANRAADLIVSEGATIMVTVLWEEIVQAALTRGITFDTMRVASIPNDNARKAMPNVNASFGAFGLTETYGPCALSNYVPGEGFAKAGKLLEGNEGKIVDPETGEELAPGQPGELLVRGNTARGYWNKPVETAKVFVEDGWFRSEDLCSIDEEGFLTWHGRLKLMLKVGGENVSIEEVEKVIAGHDAVMHCAVVGVSDKRKGEAVRAYCVLCADQRIAAEELGAWLSSRLARFKMPRDILFVEALPRLHNGKLDRLTLAEWGQQAV